MTTMEEVIEALEKATKGSRELDAAIARVLGLSDPERVSPQAYTLSLDAAMTLVPEGKDYIFARGRVRPQEKLYGAIICNPGGPEPENEIGVGESDANEATALCIAALRARLSSGETK